MVSKVYKNVCLVYSYEVCLIFTEIIKRNESYEVLMVSI